MNDIEKAIKSARQAQVDRIYKSFANAGEVIKDENGITKGQGSNDELNPFEEMLSKGHTGEEETQETEETEEVKEKKPEAEDENEDGGEAEKAETGDLEKSDIMNAFGYGSDVKVTKTGKEIAEQVDTVVLPALNAKLIEKKTDADDYLAECGNAPTKEVPVWWTGDIKMSVEYKMYDWDETCVPSNEGCGIAGSLSASDAEEQKMKRNIPENQAQANARRYYNDAVRCICEILVDIKACEILKSLKPNKEYELSPRQVVALQF